MHLWRFHREEEESWSLPDLLNFKAPVAITKFLNPDLQSKLLNAANIQCWWRAREEGEGKGREGESYKGWRRDADDLQWYSSAALSIPPLINTTLDPAIDSSSSWSTSSSPSEKPSHSVSLSLCLSVSLSVFKKKLQTSSSQAMQEIGWYQKTKKTDVFLWASKEQNLLPQRYQEIFLLKTLAQVYVHHQATEFLATSSQATFY